MKLNDLGAGGLKCQPKYTDKSRATQKNLFNQWPANNLEPSGNGAYEGVGYPGAGYGQSRRQAVKLSLPKVATALSAKGYEGKQPQSKIVTLFTLNPNSDLHTRAEVASLAGLGCACSAVDQNFVKQLNQIGAGGGGGLRGLGSLGQNLSPVQRLANAIVAGVVPDDILTRLTDKLISDEKANTAAYNTIAKLKMIDPQNRAIETLTRAQQNAWYQTNTAKFYALLVPEMQSRLGFSGGSPKVSPPDFKYIKNGDPGVFTKVADFLRDKIVGEAAQNLIRAKYMKDTTGIAGLGLVPVAAIGLFVAGLAAAGVIAYMVSKVSDIVESNANAELVATCATGKLPKAACAAALTPKTKVNVNDIFFYGAIGIGGLVALQVISTIRSAFPTR